MNYPAGKSLRMKKRTEISRVFTEGRRLTDARLTLWAIPTVQNPSPTGRGKGEGAVGASPSPPPEGAHTGGRMAGPSPSEGEGLLRAPGAARCGVAVSKAHGIAVRRNRIKRVCREAFRLIRPEVPPGWDFMIVPRVGAELKLKLIQESLRNLVRRLSPRGGKERRP